MIIIRIIAKALAFILFFALAILSMLIKVLEWFGVKIVTIFLNFLLLCVIISAVMKQWQNLAILAGMIGVVLLALVLFTMIDFLIEDRRDGLKRFIFHANN